MKIEEDTVFRETFQDLQNTRASITVFTVISTGHQITAAPFGIHTEIRGTY